MLTCRRWVWAAMATAMVMVTGGLVLAQVAGPDVAAAPSAGEAVSSAPVAPASQPAAEAPEGPGVAPGAVPVEAPPAAPAVGEAPAVAPAASAPTSRPAPATSAFGKPAEQPLDEKGKLQKDWDEFRHYILIGMEAAARSFGQAIAQSPVEDRLMYQVSETFDTESLLSQASHLSKPLQEIVGQIRKRIDKGFEVERQDPNEISRQIDRLGGTSKGYALAVKRLQLSGEYSLPQLVGKLAEATTPEDLRERIVTVLPKLGKDSVRGLSAALETDDPRLQEILANALAEVPYPQSVPALKELYDRKDLIERVRASVRAALIACGGPTVLDKPVAELYYEWAVNYYNRSESLQPDPRYEMANVWHWRKGPGLGYIPVPRAIFCDVYAMRYSLRALKHDASFYPAVPLWIAADLDKEANLPAGAVDPTRGKDQPAAGFYAVAGSAKFLQDVLARALDERMPGVNSSAVAMGAIQALSKTAGARNLVEPVAGGAQPLVRAMSHGDRRVRYLAAITLASALPQERFEGSDQVLWVLNESLRQTGKKTVLLIDSELTSRNELKDAIRAGGYEMIDEPNAPAALVAARTAGSVDVVVVTDHPPAAEIVKAMRSDPLLVAMPVVAVSDSPTLAGLAANDPRLVMLGVGAAKGQAVAQAIVSSLEKGEGKTMEADEAADWAVRTAKAIRGLGETQNPVFDISRCLTPLAGALGHPKAEVKVAAAEALAVMKDAEAQKAIAGLANDGQAAEGVRIASYNALSESLRRYGNQLTDELAQAVLTVVKGTGSQPLREAAAQATGAMNLPSQNISSLFLDTAGDSAAEAASKPAN